MSSTLETLIHQLQTTVREEAGVPTFDPSDPSLLTFPTLRDLVPNLEPNTPSHLRCKVCKGKLLRGLHSTVCIYCGAEQCKDGLALSMSFTSTIGYRKLLDFLGLDGSEPITVDGDSRDSSKDRFAPEPKDVPILSDLLDIELSWPPEKEKGETQSSSADMFPTQSSNSYFSKEKISDAPDLFENVPHGGFIVSDSIVSIDPGKVDLFSNIKSKDAIVGARNTKASESVNDSFAEWDAEFQSAESENPSKDPKPVDLFQSSASDTLRTYTDRPLGLKTESSSQQPQRASIQPSSTSDNWVADDFWDTRDKMASAADQLKEDNTIGLGEVIKSDVSLPSLEHFDTTNSQNKDPKNGEYDDTFDVWKDFANAQEVQKMSDFPIEMITAANNKERQINPKDMEDSLEDMDFGSFRSEPKGVDKPKSDLEEKENVQLKALASDRMTSVENTTVETLLSQMNDLSFMLEDKLSIPESVKSPNSAP